MFRSKAFPTPKYFYNDKDFPTNPANAFVARGLSTVYKTFYITYMNCAFPLLNFASP